MDKNYSTGKSIFAAIVGLIAFYIIFGIASLVLFLVFIIISFIPILSKIAGWLFYLRGDTPFGLTVLISAVLASSIVKAIVIPWVGGKKENVKLSTSFKTTGILLIVINAVNLIVGLVGPDRRGIPTNIIMLLAGIKFIIDSRKFIS